MYLLDTSIASFSFRVDPLLQLYNDELESGAACSPFEGVSDYSPPSIPLGWQAPRQLLGEFLAEICPSTPFVLPQGEADLLCC